MSLKPFSEQHSPRIAEQRYSGIWNALRSETTLRVYQKYVRRMEFDGVDNDFALSDDFFQSPLHHLVEYTLSQNVEGNERNETFTAAEVQLTIRRSIHSLELASHFGMFLIYVILIIKFRRHRILSPTQPSIFYVIFFGSAVIAISGVFLGSNTNNIENVTPEDTISNRLCSKLSPYSSREKYSSTWH